MAPELFNTVEGKSGLPTYRSDIFALGMVTFEVRNSHRGESFRRFETPSCAFLQVFTGQLPFPESKNSGVVIKKIINGERPLGPPMGKKLGLSDELWGLVRSSLVHEAEERPPAETFVGLLEKLNPSIAVLEELTEFDANSKKHLQELRRVFEYGDNTLFGMREAETLVVIEVLDRVNLPTEHLFTPQERF